MGSNIVRFDQVRASPIADITAAYTPIGFITSPTVPAPFTHAMRVLHFSNDSNGTYMISFDGTTDNVPVLSGSFDLYDLTSDQDENEMFRYQVGTQLYIRYVVAPTTMAGASNTVYTVAVYGKGE